MAEGIADDLIDVAILGRLAKAVRLSDELLASGRGLDSRDQVSTSCAMPCHVMEKTTHNKIQYNKIKYSATLRNTRKYVSNNFMNISLLLLLLISCVMNACRMGGQRSWMRLMRVMMIL